MKSCEKTGKTVDAAVFSALEELGATIDEVIVEVLEEGETGVFGIGRKQARVLVTLDRVDANLGQEISKAVDVASNKFAGASDTFSEANAPEESSYFGDDSDYYDEVLGDSEETTKTFLMDVLAAMDLDADVFVSCKDDAVCVDIEGENLGSLIGRRGETLYALQYLASLVLNKDAEQFRHLRLDISDYRKRREQSLRDLAFRTAHKVLKVRKEYVMEAMNAAERRVIHTALQDFKGVETTSEGEEPNRHVVVIPLSKRD